ncbi:hypothetical protein ElyMa_005732800 [Elysia marginata]|uniref:Uncharacterized protein n=1 Tax=Elysia marginata TaxID=1093978 RepID=A0AAV4FMK1_9GAST|nr:hypothetical protein ElyMa_005732800 [Elysia marginata]
MCIYSLSQLPHVNLQNQRLELTPSRFGSLVTTTRPRRQTLILAKTLSFLLLTRHPPPSNKPTNTIFHSRYQPFHSYIQFSFIPLITFHLYDSASHENTRDVYEIVMRPTQSATGATLDYQTP